MVFLLATSSEAISVPAYALNELLRANVSKVQNRVFPPGIQRDARMPRITISPLSPVEKRVGIGERYGSYMGLWYKYVFRVDVWDKDAAQVEDVADQVLYTIWKNRDYVPNSPRNTYGQFVNLETTGGSATDLNKAHQLYQRTINISGLWLSKSSEVF